ncbi:uncharacterized protein PHALS_05782 [Plasmopara halstedii]|uniref:Uncharacterized protein n=1 Tax=Plasmopara halstedii TaxID=4781 RepID=A0A0P1ABL7_PLAHL|nr:uncharacterized protein PHALS_05782 [Plasmopara halstedii]CEG37725.1 hypothetical protein PHALS_05782 [Plasmopara halstedii]|eukprot:XP_024574094.1 hypothetical protein PHALS_05782 [Plasmopara halstedii]
MFRQDTDYMKPRILRNVIVNLWNAGDDQKLEQAKGYLGLPERFETSDGVKQNLI